MSDARRRELERRAAAGDVEAKGQLLLMRVRLGELVDEQVRLAAYLGHPGAISAVAEVVAGLPQQAACGVEALGTWGSCLHTFGSDAPVRAAVAAARVATQVISTILMEAAVLNAIEAAEDWIADPNPETRARARDAAVVNQAQNAATAIRMSQDIFARLNLPQDSQLAAKATERAITSAIHAAHAAARAASRGALHEGSPHSAEAGRKAAEQAERALTSACWALEDQPDGVQRVVDAVQGDLLPWALGEGDPLKDRVKDRS